MTTVTVAAEATPSVADLLVARVDDDHPGLRFGEQAWSWRQVVAASADRAALIRSMSGSEQEKPFHVGVLLGNIPEYVFWLGAEIGRAHV